MNTMNLSTHTQFAKLDKLITAHKTSDGAGVNLRRSLGSYQLPTLDPFLLLDEFKSDDPNDYIAGFPSHPHRGFETVTYMLAGKMKHEDNKGNQGIIQSGGVQWMTAGRGIVHSEMPMQENGLMWGFQIWVNLPAKDKMKAPNYQNIEPESIPELQLENGSSVRVIAGESHGIEGIIRGVAIDPLMLDVRLKAGSEFIQPLSPVNSTMLYAYTGSGQVQSSVSQFQEIGENRLGILDKGEAVKIVTHDSPLRLLLLSGKPVNEAVAKYGPFVMNTQDEIKQAIHDFQSGQF